MVVAALVTALFTQPEINNVQVQIDGKTSTVEVKELQEYYDNLSVKYNELLIELAALQNDKNILQSQYNTSVENYDKLLLKDDDWQGKYTSLQKQYDELLNNQEKAINNKKTSETANNDELAEGEFMLNVVPAYQSGNYKEYKSNLGSADSFSMAGKKYVDGCVWASNSSLFNEDGYALYTLDKNYTSITGILGHVDGTSMSAATLFIFFDGKLHEEIGLTGDMIAQEFSIDVADVNQLKLVVEWRSGPSSYGYGDIKLT